MSMGPNFDYECTDCKEIWVVWKNNQKNKEWPEHPKCPKCGKKKTKRIWAAVAFDIAQGKFHPGIDEYLPSAYTPKNKVPGYSQYESSLYEN